MYLLVVALLKISNIINISLFKGRAPSMHGRYDVEK